MSIHLQRDAATQQVAKKNGRIWHQRGDEKNKGHELLSVAVWRPCAIHRAINHHQSEISGFKTSLSASNVFSNFRSDLWLGWESLIKKKEINQKHSHFGKCDTMSKILFHDAIGEGTQVLISFYREECTGEHWEGARCSSCCNHSACH